MVTIDLTAP